MKEILIQLRLFFLFVFILCGLAGKVFALHPISHYHDLVAGEGSRGLKDGSFDTAFFYYPAGLAINAEGTRLYVADKANHAIRIIHLDENNQVETLTGTGKPGYLDGPLTKALFNQPVGLAFLPGDRLAVDDLGNAYIRVIDLKAGTVSTLAGTGGQGPEEGPFLKAGMGGIWNMAYLASENALYVTQPDLGTLKKLDLKTTQVTLVCKKQAGLPNPAALCVSGGQLYAADRKEPNVYQVEKKSKDPASFKQAGMGKNIVSLGGSGKYLYAVQGDPLAPLQRILPVNEPVVFTTAWGETYKDLGMAMPAFKDIDPSDPIGFVADPNNERKFYISNFRNQVVTSVRDLYFTELQNSEQVNSNLITDYEYPTLKPPKTYRILLVGDSHSFHTFGAEIKKEGRTYYNRQVMMSKRLELILNTQGALEDVPINFEVINMGIISSDPLFLWPCYEVPAIAQKYNVDLVLLLMVPSGYQDAFFERPLTREGIPARRVDPEYLLKPYQERIPEGVVKKFYNLCKAKNLVTISNGHIYFPDFKPMTEDPSVNDCLVQMCGKPMGLLKEKLSGLKTKEGKSVSFQLIFTPTGLFAPRDEFSQLWQKISRENHIGYYDFSNELTALRPTYYPFSEVNDNDHFGANGHLLMGYLLAHELIQQKIIPWNSAPQNSKDQK